jgi:hypothetical protein
MVSSRFPKPSQKPRYAIKTMFLVIAGFHSYQASVSLTSHARAGKTPSTQGFFVAVLVVLQ